MVGHRVQVGLAPLGAGGVDEAQVAGTGSGKSLEAVLGEASQTLSGLTRSAGVVLTAQANVRLKHIEFVRLEPERALAVLVAEDGQVENRVLNVPTGLPTSALIEAGNFLNARIRGKTIADLRAEIETALAQGKAELDQLTQKIISAGLASWSGGESDEALFFCHAGVTSTITHLRVSVSPAAEARVRW